VRGHARGWGSVSIAVALACTVLAGATPRSASTRAAEAMTLQVALDRAGVSPGIIDGRAGHQTATALALFQQAHGLAETGTLDTPSRSALQLETLSPTQPYTVSAGDVAGPFVRSVPADLSKQGTLAALGYTSVLELLAERFHTDEAALRRLNPRARFRAGETIQVPAVEPMVLPAESKRRDGAGAEASRVGAITVSRDPSVVVVADTNGNLLFAAPVTSGSEHDPLPLGEWKVTDVYLLPVFHYNPALFWDADPSHAQTTIKPGPNNPAGAAWIDIDREHYGLHGTPEPRIVGRSTSHGCVRLTNWDITRLLTFVKPGTRVVFSDRPVDLHTRETTVQEPGDDVETLKRRHLQLPVQEVTPSDLVPTFHQVREGHTHEALDIMAPRGAPVLAVEDGTIAKLFYSKAGGLTIYHFDPAQGYAYYYAHLDRYADGLKQGAAVKRGQVLGYVGSTGNADRAHPHLHFTIFKLGPERHWWKGTAIDPYPIFMAGSNLSRRSPR
jgi:lipoprotein-anchoring transpeptidase ErfK/SrfK